jgi:hypothetical protein
MVSPDRAGCLLQLIQAAEKVLTDAGRPNDAVRVGELFRANALNSKLSIGMNQFYMALAQARVADA